MGECQMGVLATTGERNKEQIDKRVLLIGAAVGQVLKGGKKKWIHEQAAHTTTLFCEFKLRSHTQSCPVGHGSRGSRCEQPGPEAPGAWLHPHTPVPEWTHDSPTYRQARKSPELERGQGSGKWAGGP